MVGIIEVFSVIAGIIFLGFIAELIFKKTKIPDVLFLILLGFIISSILGWVDKNSFGFAAILFTNFTLLFILFQGALSIDFITLLKSLKGSFKISLISFILTSLVVCGIGFYILNLPFLPSLMMGFILGGTCSAVVIPLVSNLSIEKKYSSIISLESAITDVLSVIGTITIIAIFNKENIATTEIVKSIISSFFLSISIGIFVGLIWVFLLAKSKYLLESYMVTIALVISLFSFVESPFVGANGAIAVLSFGLILGNSQSLIDFYINLSKKNKLSEKKESFVSRTVLSHSARNFYSEISFFVKVFFFVYVGIIMDFSQPLIFVKGLLITSAIFLIRPIAVKISFFNEPINNKTKAILRSLIPKGLASAVLAELAFQNNIPYSKEILDIVFSVILISIILSSLLVFLSDKVYKDKNQNFLKNNKKIAKELQIP